MKTFIFDFDGTLAESLDVLFVITNQLAEEFGFAPVGHQEFQSWRSLTSRELLSQKRIPWWKLPSLVRRVKREQYHRIRQIRLVLGMGEALLALRDRGSRLGILTSNSSSTVEAFLENQGLEGIFEFVYAGSTLFGKDKLLRRVIQAHQLDPDQVIYVGDEVRDIEAAHRVPMPVAAVSWGFNTLDVLASVQPDYLLQQPKDLLSLGTGLGATPELSSQQR